ncbi:MAG: MFS transporter, partial [Clostridiales bacterium]|nr:MFS transporter [Clostridiales bacterium]
VGFYMGFSLEPSQDAFDKAYTAMADEAGQTQADGIPDAGKAIDGYLSDARALMLEGKAAELTALELKLPDADPALKAPLQEKLTGTTLAFAQQNAPLIDDYRASISRSTLMFWAMAILVGTVQGGIQAVSRSYFGKLVPKKRSNEYFGFFDIFGKFATFVGPLLYALIGSLSGRSSFGTLALLTLFLAGFITLILARKPLEQLEKRKEAEAS